MIIWSDTLKSQQIRDAAAKAHAYVFDVRLSGMARKRLMRWTVYLSGDSPHANGHDSSRPAATWDQWGIFLNALFEADPNMTTAQYATNAEFHRITCWRFVYLTYEDSHRRHKWDLRASDHYTCDCGATFWPKWMRNAEEVSA